MAVVGRATRHGHRCQASAPPRPPRPADGPPGRATWAGRRTGRGGRPAPPRTAGRGGWRRTRPRAAPAPRPASRARSARRSRAPCPSGRRRRPRAGRRGRASGPKATLGRCRRASRARLTNSATASGSLRGRSPGRARVVRSRGHVHADRGNGEDRLRHVRRVEAAGQRDRHLARDGGCERRVDPDPGPARVRAAGGVEQDPASAGVQERAGAGDDIVRVCVRAHAERLPDRASHRGDGGGRLVAVELHLVGIDGGDDARELAGRQVRGHDDDLRARPGGRGRRAREPGQLDPLLDREGAGCPRGEVETDGVRTRADGCEDPGGVGDAADLDTGLALGGGQVHGVPSRGHERPRRRGRVRGAHERLADESRIEAGGAPAGDGGGVPDAALRDARRSPGTRSRSQTHRSGSTSSVRRSRLLIPISRAPVASAASISRASCASTSGSSPRSRARATSFAIRFAGCSTARRRTRSAPAARRRSSCRGSTMNSLARTGTETAALTARRSATDPPNQWGSQRTEMAAAPPAA